MMAYKGIEMKNARPIIGVHVVGILRILSALWVELNRMNNVRFVRVSWRLCICFFSIRNAIRPFFDGHSKMARGLIKNRRL